MLEKQKKEAKIRMRLLTQRYNLNPNLNKYLEEGRIYYSYIVGGAFGCIDTINYDKSYADFIKRFEKERNAYVYHAIETETIYGKMLALLYVSSNINDWEAERPKSNFIASYVHNMTEDKGEFGDIFLTSDNGALVRTA